jgi:hypothetical protein
MSLAQLSAQPPQQLRRRRPVMRPLAQLSTAPQQVRRRRPVMRPARQHSLQQLRDMESKDVPDTAQPPAAEEKEASMSLGTAPQPAPQQLVRRSC